MVLMLNGTIQDKFLPSHLSGHSTIADLQSNKTSATAHIHHRSSAAIKLADPLEGGAQDLGDWAGLIRTGGIN